MALLTSNCTQAAAAYQMDGPPWSPQCRLQARNSSRGAQSARRCVRQRPAERRRHLQVLHTAALLAGSPATSAAALHNAPTVPANESFANLTKPEGAAVTAGTAAAAAAGGTISGTAGIRTSSIRLWAAAGGVPSHVSGGGRELEALAAKACGRVTEQVIADGLAGGGKSVQVIPNSLKAQIRRNNTHGRLMQSCPCRGGRTEPDAIAAQTKAAQASLNSLQGAEGAATGCHGRPCLCSLFGQLRRLCLLSR